MKHPVNLGNTSVGLAGRAMTLLVLLLLVGIAAGKGVRVELDANPVAADETLGVTFIVDGKQSAEPDFSPLEKDFQLLGSSRSTSISIVNGRTSKSTSYRLSLLPKRTGELFIPAIRFGQLSSEAVPVKVLNAEQLAKQAGVAAPARDVFMEVSIDDSSPYVQQQVILSVRIYSRLQWRDAKLSEPELKGGEVLLQKLGDDRQYQAMRDGKNWTVIERKYALFPQQSGSLNLQPMLLELRIPEPRSQRRSSFSSPFMEDFFGSARYKRKIVRSQALHMDVQPPPQSFSGRHWLVARNLVLEERWSLDPSDLQVGEPVTRTLILKVDGATLGQLPELQMPEVDGVRVYPDEAETDEQVTAAGLVASSTRRFALIPQRSGDFLLPGVSLKWWNSLTNREEEARLPERRLVVTGATVPVAQSPVPPGGSPVMESADMGESGEPPNRLTEGNVSPSSSELYRYSTYVLAVLWLITLWLWWRARQRPASQPAVKTAEKPAISARRTWNYLHQAVQAGDPGQMRTAVLEVARVLWPQRPPNSLEALADRVPGSARQELEKLSRSLYAGTEEAWDAEVIEKQLKNLAKTTALETTDQNSDSALRPLYPR